jgi:hypothetical protein
MIDSLPTPIAMYLAAENGRRQRMIVSRVYQERAASELAVQSGHNVCENREGEREVIRILRVELQRESAIAGR